MIASFIVTLDVGSDTDLLSISDEIHDLVEHQFTVQKVAPFIHPTLEATLPSAPGVPGQPQNQT